MEGWLRRTGHPLGAIVSFSQMWALAQGWYAGRLRPGWRGRSPEEARAIIDGVGLTGDFNPHHVDPAFMARTRFEKPVLPGLLVASMMTHVGGTWAILAHEVSFIFHQPGYSGDTVTLFMKVTEISPKNRATIEAVWTNEEGDMVLSGTLYGYPPREKERRLLINRP